MKKLTLFMWLFVAVTVIFAQDADSVKVKKKPEDKKVRYNIVPLPSYDPSTKFGITLAQVFTFNVDRADTISPPSVFGTFFQATTNGSLLGGIGGTAYFDDDNWRINPQIAVARFHQKLSLGFPEAADARRKIFFVNLEGLRHVYKRIYFGLGYNYTKVVYEGRDEQSEQQLELVGLLGGGGNHGVKYIVNQDTRDNVYYPYKGYYAGVKVEQFFENKSQPAYMAYYLDYKHFYSLTPKEGKHVLGYRFLCRFLGGDPVEQNYTYYGRTGGEIERGYETGTYIDKNMFNFEAEYRLRTPWLKNRLGFVGFTGVGKVFGDYKTFSEADILPMVGAGARYMLQQDSRMNVRFDATVGREGFMFYFGIMEAF